MSSSFVSPKVHTYTFGALKVHVKGLGVYLGDKHLEAACDALTAEELRTANREAWRQRNSAVRIANGQCNVSLHGWNDRRDQLIDVAGIVCKETWKRISRAD